MSRRTSFSARPSVSLARGAARFASARLRPAEVPPLWLPAQRGQTLQGRRQPPFQGGPTVPSLSRKPYVGPPFPAKSEVRGEGDCHRLSVFINNSGYVWADDSQWRIDTPQDPHSILPLILNHRWVELDLDDCGRSETPRPTGFRKEEALDLREVRVSAHLRGADLDLKGAKCYFWVHSGGTRWHYTGRPLKIHQGKWGPP